MINKRSTKSSKVSKGSKGSKYIGVYKCSKTKLYYFKNFRNKKLYKSRLFKKEIDAAYKYDSFVLKYKPNKKKLNFPKSNKLNNNKNNKNLLTNKKNTLKRPKISEFIKIIIYSRQDDKCLLCKKSLGVGRIIDHIIPRFLGGIDNINNYQAICGTCNKWKTYKFDHYINNYLKINKKISLNKILTIQKNEFNNFNGPYPDR